MIDIVKQTIDFFVKNGKEPSINDIKIKDKSLLEKKWCVFVTIYKNWEIRWSAGNIKEIEENIALEIIKSTISSISQDTRFKPITQKEAKLLKIRLDIIEERKTIKEWTLNRLDPIKYWVIAIKKDYKNLAVILPNISPNLLTWEDFHYVLGEKLWTKFNEKDFIIYEIKTKIYRSY